MSMFQKPKNSTGLKIYDKPFNIIEFKKSLKEMKKRNDKLKYRIKNPYKSRKKTKTNNKTYEANIKTDKKGKKEQKNEKKKEQKKEMDSIYLPEVPDLGRYNPSYEVLDKHIYQVSISKQDYYTFNKEGTKHNERKIFKNCKY